VQLLLYSYAQLQGPLLLAIGRLEWRELDPEPRVLTLLYIGRRSRVTRKAIGLTDYILGLLQQNDPRYPPDAPVSVCLDSPRRSMVLTLAGLPSMATRPVAW
jgi:hypothetical protein